MVMVMQAPTMFTGSWALGTTHPSPQTTTPTPAPTRPAPTEQSSDEQLLQALQAADVRALELLYDRYSRLAFGLAYRIVNDTTAAEDVVQEAFLNVWRQAPTFNTQRGAARTWLLSIVHHRAIDYLRSRAARRQDVQLDLVERSLAIADTWTTVARHVERDEIRQALATLPAEQRQTVELAYFAGYSQPEIAAAMNVPLSTIKGRMRMAMHKLRLLLAPTHHPAPAL